MLPWLLVLQIATNAQLGYRFTLPSGFVSFPAGRSQPDVVDCWTEIAAPSSGGALILCIQRMHTTMGRERLKQADLPPQVHLTAMKWKGFEIDGVRTDTVQAGFPVVAYAAQVPLKPEAIQIIVGGPRDQGARAEEVLTSVLGSLDGETNWLSSTARAGRMGTIVGWIVGIIIGLVIVRMVVTRRRAPSV